MRKTQTDSFSERKLRTRTLIQLGGLLEKSGLLNEMDIALGDDLQQDETRREVVACLFGALLEMKSMAHDQAQKNIWTLKGQQAFGKS